MDRIEATRTETERAHDQLGKPFAHTDELTAARVRLAGIEIELAGHAVPDRSAHTGSAANGAGGSALDWPASAPQSDTIRFDRRHIDAHPTATRTAR